MIGEAELYRSLGGLTMDKVHWEQSIPYVALLLLCESTKIKAKALWLLGEMGLAFPQTIKGHVTAIADFCDSTEPLLRERAVNALGRIGRGATILLDPTGMGCSALQMTGRRKSVWLSSGHRRT